MGDRGRPDYEEYRAQGWLAWTEVEEQVGQSDVDLRRWARSLREGGLWPTDLPRPVTFPRAGQGGDVLYHPNVPLFLRDAVVLHPYAHLRGQRHSVERKIHPLPALGLLLAARGRDYEVAAIRQGVVGVVEQFRALTGGAWSPDRLGAWLYTGGGARERGKRSAYWSAKIGALMAWLSLLAGVPVRRDVWGDQCRPPSWPKIIQDVGNADQATLRAWIAALRPLVDGWCFPTPEPQTEKEILSRLFAPPPPPEEIRRDNIATRIFRLLNRGLEDAYWTRPGKDDNAKDPRLWSDVKRWEENRKRLGHRLAEPAPEQEMLTIPAYGRFMWRRARLYEVNTGKVLFEVPKDRSRYYPDNQEEVVTRLFKYAGVFVALGVATSDPARTDPVAPLPPGHSLPWKCRFCDVPLRAAIIGNQPKVWCPQCFTEAYELAGFLARHDEDRKTFKVVIPQQ